MLAVRERGEHHRHVPLPRRGRIDEVDVVARDELLEAVVAARCTSAGAARPLSVTIFAARFALSGTTSHSATIFTPSIAEQLVEHRPAAQPGADDADAHRLVAVEWHAAHRGA